MSREALRRLYIHTMVEDIYIYYIVYIYIHINVVYGIGEVFLKVSFSIRLEVHLDSLPYDNSLYSTSVDDYENGTYC